MSIYNAAWAIPLLPLLGALGSLGVETQRRAAQFCVFFSGLAFVVAAVVLGVRLTHAPAPPFLSLLTFFSMSPPEGATFATQFTAQVGVQVDALSASFAAAIAFATMVIQGYAVNSIRGEQGVRRFFCASSVLAFCTTGFVLSPNLFDSLILWVGASASLYVLLSLTWQRAEIAHRAMRAMVVLTAGDIALTLGVVFTWIKFGVFSSLLAAPSGQSLADPFSFSVISQGVIATLHHGVASTGPRALLVMGIVFLVAAAVRSVQFPFTVWLTDAASSAMPVLALAAATVAPLGLFLDCADLPDRRAHPASASGARIVRRRQRHAYGGDRYRAAEHHADRGVRRRNGARSRTGRARYGRLQPGCLHRIHLGLHVDAAAACRWPTSSASTAPTTSPRWVAHGRSCARPASRSASGRCSPAGSGSARTTRCRPRSAASTRPEATSAGSSGSSSLIVTLVAAAMAALLAGRLLLTVTSGAIARRRGFAHERVAEVEGGLRRPVWLAIIAAIVVVLIGLPGLHPFYLGSKRVAGLTFLRFVVYGGHPQSIGLDGGAALLALLALVVGLGAAYLVFGPARRRVALPAFAAWPRARRCRGVSTSSGSPSSRRSRSWRLRAGSRISMSR